MYPLTTYYRARAREDAELTRGGIFWCFVPVPYAGRQLDRYHLDSRPPERIDVARFNPDSQRADRGDNTKSDEFLGVLKLQRRPVVLLGGPGDPFPEAIQERWQGGNQVLVAPMYRLWREDTKRYKEGPEFVLNALKYNYSGVFFLPGHRGFDQAAGIVRFDRLHTMHTSWLERTRVCLTADALGYLHEWLGYYLTGESTLEFQQDLGAFREWLDKAGTVEVSEDRLPHGLFEDN